jgi:D-arginine dehydrogenase
MKKCEILIIGGGVAGLATAYSLVKNGVKDVVVIEQEKSLGGHASGRNAGMIRQAISDPALAGLAVEGRQALENKTKEGWDLGWAPNGSLLLAGDDQTRELEAIAANLEKNGLLYQWLSKKQAQSFVCILKDGDFKKALFCPSDAAIEIKKLLRCFLKELKNLNVPVLCGREVLSIQKKQAGFELRAQKESFLAKTLVNAAGAWAPVVAGHAGASQVPMTAYRRHLFLSGVSKYVEPSWPFVWDLSHNFYFRPSWKCLLMSPCDKVSQNSRLTTHDSRQEKIDPKMKQVLMKKLKAFSRIMSRIQLKSAQSGLRTMTPDGRFVVGEDPKLKNFFWVAGLGGHGITTCFSVGRLAADLILGKKRESFLTQALSPERFVSHAS